MYGKPLENSASRWSGPVAEALLVALILALANLVFRMSPLVASGAFGDDGIYISLGKALAEQHEYRSIYAVGAPVHLKYPPGLPAIFAVLWWVGGTLSGFETLVSALNLVVCGAAAGLIWWLGRVRLELPPFLVLLFAVGPFFLEATIQYFNLAISEPYYVLAWLSALVIYYRAAEARTRAAQFRGGLALGLLVSAGILIRLQGVVLLPAFLLAALIDRISWRAIAGYTLSASAPVVAWFWFHGLMVAGGPVSTQPDEASYLSWIPWQNPLKLLDFAGSSLASNWSFYWKILPLQLNELWHVGVALCIGFLLLATVGSILLARRHSALMLTTLANTVLIALWPYAQERFIITLLPCTGLLIAAALSRVDLGRIPSLRLPALAGLMLLVGLVTLRQISIRSYAFAEEDPQVNTSITYPSHFLASNTRFLLMASQWVVANTSRDDRILIETPAGLYLHAGRQAVSSAPAESQIVPSIFESQGQFLKGRILEDSITVVALGSVASPLASDIMTFQQACPGILVFQGAAQPDGWPIFYRVVRDDECMLNSITESASDYKQGAAKRDRQAPEQALLGP